MTLSTEAIAIVTGGASWTARQLTRGLASWDWAIVVVYLEHQREAETTVAEILAAEGRTVAVRADLTDELDVERLFAESVAAFGGVDVVAHTTTESGAQLYRQAAEHLRRGGVIVSVSGTEATTPVLGRRLRERGITVGTAQPGAMLAFLDRWRHGRSG
jgi:3-oxoacyl-[acyl-carrier protein] reductase